MIVPCMAEDKNFSFIFFNSTRAETPWSGDRFRGVFRGICQRKGDQLDP